MIVASFLGGVLYADSIHDPAPASMEEQTGDTKLYTNEQWHFSVRYPAMMDEITENPNSIVFGMKGDSWLSGYVVNTKEAPFDSTKEWLDAQPKGDFSSEGYELILWLDHQQQTAVVAEYVEYDRRPDGTYVHGRYFYAVRIDNGILYKFHVGGAVQFEERGVPQISSDSLEFVHSFKPYIE